MKKIFLFLVLVLFSFQAWATDYTQDASIGFAFLLDETSGNYLDSSTNNLTMTRYGGTMGATGQFNKAWDGSSSQNNGLVVTAATAINDLTQFTWIMWVKDVGFGSTDMIASKKNLQFYTYASNTGVNMVLHASGGYSEAKDTTPISTVAFDHIAITYDDTATRYAHVYRNGVETTYATHYALTGTLDTDNDKNFSLQCDQVGVFGKALYDDVAILSRSISSTEINDIKDNGLKPAGGAIDDSQVFMIS